MTLRDRIKRLANDRNMSLPELETELGFGSGTIVKWGTSAPRSDKLCVVADFFDVSVDALLGRDKSLPLTKREQDLLQQFRNMSEQGQQYMLETAAMASSRYLKKSDMDEAIRCHT